MRIVAGRRVKERRFVNPNALDGRRITELKQERCGVCDGLYPASFMQWEDGRRRCSNCVDIRGTVALAEITAEAYQWIAEGSAVEAQEFPTHAASDDSPTGVVVSMLRASGTDVTQTSPLVLARGVNTTLALHGQGFSTSDTIAYSTGISDGAAVSRTATLTTLTLLADVGMTAGDYNLTFNGTTYRGIFRVR
jgi:hypothetical protein